MQVYRYYGIILTLTIIITLCGMLKRILIVYLYISGVNLCGVKKVKNSFVNATKKSRTMNSYQSLLTTVCQDEMERERGKRA